MKRGNVLVAVESEDYVHALVRCCDSCVLAKAIQRATGDTGWLVDGDAIRHAKKDIWAATLPELDDLANWADFILPDKTINNTSGTTVLSCSFMLNTKTGEVSDYKPLQRLELYPIMVERAKLGLITMPQYLDYEKLDEMERIEEMKEKSKGFYE